MFAATKLLTLKPNTILQHLSRIIYENRCNLTSWFSMICTLQQMSFRADAIHHTSVCHLHLFFCPVRIEIMLNIIQFQMRWWTTEYEMHGFGAISVVCTNLLATRMQSNGYCCQNVGRFRNWQLRMQTNLSVRMSVKCNTYKWIHPN